MAFDGALHALRSCPPGEHLAVCHELVQQRAVIAVVVRVAADAKDFGDRPAGLIEASQRILAAAY